MSKLTKALTAAAGNAGAGALYVDDVFSTYLYTGTGSNITIDNGIDLDGEGGMVWFKTRSTANGNNIYDTERGNGAMLYITTEAQYTNTNTPWNPTSTGFNTGGDYGGSETQNGSTTASWTFRKAEKFFDVVTYTGATGPVAHNLGSVPKVIMIKAVSGTYSTNDWMVYHANVGAPFLNLNDSGAAAGNFWTTSITDTHFTPPGNTSTNGNGTTYVAYLFASDAGGFGDDGSESIIKCGTYTGATSGTNVIDLGFEPQWVMIKGTDRACDWVIFDNMRPWPTDGTTSFLRANTSAAEASNFGNKLNITSTGFSIPSASTGNVNEYNEGYIYIAIRRPMKTPESGTEVFAVDDRAFATPAFVSDFPVDLYWRRSTIAGTFRDYARLRGDNYLQHDGTNAETSGTAFFDSNTGVGSGGSASTTDLAWMFKRATGFFDVVAYTGNTTTQAINHNLGVTPELIIVKARQSNIVWAVWSKSLEQYELLQLSTSNPVSGDAGDYGYWTSTAPTSTQFSVGTYDTANKANEGMIAYLFATLAGVSKVGSYTGTGSNVDVDCGFSAGARFILIKRTDSTGDWYVYDSFRGIVSGNDPYLLLNTGTGEVTSTDYIDPLASGFTVTSSAPAALNASGGTYIFLAIA